MWNPTEETNSPFSAEWCKYGEVMAYSAKDDVNTKQSQRLLKLCSHVEQKKKNKNKTNAKRKKDFKSFSIAPQSELVMIFGVY